MTWRAVLAGERQWTVEHGDSRAVLAALPAASIDAVVCDPPYMLGFMGKEFDRARDNIAADPDFWRLVLRVAKPGAHLLAAGGDRTFHRLVCAIEDAGWQIRHTICHLQGQGFPKSLNVSDAANLLIPEAERCRCSVDIVNNESIPDELSGSDGRTDTRPVEAGAPFYESRSSGRAEDFRGDYRRDDGSDDERLLEDAEGARERLPSRDDVLEHSRGDHSGDAPGGALGRIPARSSNDPPSSVHSVHAAGEQGAHPDDANGVSGRQMNTSGVPALVPHKTRGCTRNSVDSVSDSPSGNRYVAQCATCRKWCVTVGLGTALKPAVELWCLARAPLAGTVAENVLTHGTGALNVGACRVGYASADDAAAIDAKHAGMDTQAYQRPAGVSLELSVSPLPLVPAHAHPEGRWPPNVLLSHLPECRRLGTKETKPGWYSGARAKGMGYGGANSADADGSLASRSTATEAPLYDCSPGCSVAALDAQSGERPGMNGGGQHRPGYEGGMFGSIDSTATARGDTGGASRFFPQFEFGELDAPFFFCPKASRSEREAGLDGFPVRSAGEATEREDGTAGLQSPRAGAGRTGGRDGEGVRNLHPTVKPVALMRWLVRLVTPPNGTVLDPFCGSGSTGIAAGLEGFRFVGIEQNNTAKEPYVDIARARIAHAVGGTFRPEAVKLDAAPSGAPIARDGQLKMF